MELIFFVLVIIMSVLTLVLGQILDGILGAMSSTLGGLACTVPMYYLFVDGTLTYTLPTITYSYPAIPFVVFLIVLITINFTAAMTKKW